MGDDAVRGLQKADRKLTWLEEAKQEAALNYRLDGEDEDPFWIYQDDGVTPDLGFDAPWYRRGDWRET